MMKSVYSAVKDLLRCQSIKDIVARLAGNNIEQHTKDTYAIHQ